MDEMQLHRPATLPEALALLAEFGEDGRVLSGGTALTLLIKHRLAQPAHLVSLRRIINLADLITRPDGMNIGAMCTHRQMETSPLLAHHCRMLAHAYGQSATVRVRNMATVGGGLAHADPNQDAAPALMALDARAVVVSQRGHREVRLDRLFKDYFETSLRPGEVIVSVQVPPLPNKYGAAYVKFLPRTEDDYGTVNVAAFLEAAEDGSVARARVALSSVGVTPLRARAVERALVGRRPTPERLREVSELVRGEIDPADDFRGSAEYKRHMAVVFTRRALEGAARFDDGMGNYRAGGR